MCRRIFDEIKVKKTVIPFEKNAQILLFTDGVLEAIANDEFEAEEKLRTFTERKWGDLEGEIEGFYKEEQKKAQSDDMCLIMIQTMRIKAYEIQTEDFIRFYCIFDKFVR